MTPYGDLHPSPRILLGPGPSMADPRVLRAMSTSLLGQFDPEFTAIMNEVTELIRFAFETENQRAFPVPGTGRAGLEAAITSLVEPGDRVVVGECGRFGLLLIEIAERCGADIAVAGTQKCLSCPSGLAPITYDARVDARLARRREKVRSNYLDLAQIADYWSPRRFNHHTAPTTMVYGLREALRAFHAEGRAARFARHRLHGDAMRSGVEALGLSIFGTEPPEHRLPFLIPVVVPDGLDELRVRRRLIDEFGVEIGAAFGPLLGKIWRIGTMGYSASRQNGLTALAALEQVLRAEGWRCAAGAGVDAARACYRAAGVTTGDVADSLGAGGIGRV